MVIVALVCNGNESRCTNMKKSQGLIPWELFLIAIFISHVDYFLHGLSNDFSLADTELNAGFPEAVNEFSLV